MLASPLAEWTYQVVVMITLIKMNEKKNQYQNFLSGSSFWSAYNTDLILALC